MAAIIRGATLAPETGLGLGRIAKRGQGGARRAEDTSGAMPPSPVAGWVYVSPLTRTRYSQIRLAGCSAKVKEEPAGRGTRSRAPCQTDPHSLLREIRHVNSRLQWKLTGLPAW